MTNSGEGLHIAAVERDTGLSKDVLRVWERRYGFPTPQRDVHGERRYSASQVERLRLVKRLMDQGHRPGRLLGLPADELEALSARPAGAAARPAATAAAGADPDHEADLEALVALLRRHAAQPYTEALQQRLARDGLHRFVQDIVAPLTSIVGSAWERGELRVFEEHLFTELTARLLRQAIAGVPGGAAPRVLLTSLPQEQHAMGLLMVEALLALEGAQCIPLGTQTPLVEIVQAAAAHRADVVALSFSAAFPARQIAPLLAQLRASLPASTGLWAGGAGVRRVAAPQGVLVAATLAQAVSAIEAWRAAQRPADAAG